MPCFVKVSGHRLSSLRGLLACRPRLGCIVHDKVRSVRDAISRQRVTSDCEVTITSSETHLTYRTFGHTVERMVGALLKVFRINREGSRQDIVADDLTCITCWAVSGFTPHFADVVCHDNLLNTIFKSHLWPIGPGILTGPPFPSDEPVG